MNEVMSFFFTGRREGVLWVQEEVEKLLAIYEEDQEAAYHDADASAYFDIASKIDAVREVLDRIKLILDFDKEDEGE